MLARSRAVVVHSRFAQRRLRLTHGEAATAHVAVIPHPLPPGEPPARGAARARLGIPPGDFLLVTAGFAARAKRLDWVAAALAALPGIRWIHAGGADPEQAAAVADRARVTGHLDAANFADHIAAADVLVTLRFPSQGESSGPLARGLAAGVCCLVSDTAAYAELPRDAVIHLPLAGGARALAAALAGLLADPGRAAAIGAAGRRHALAEMALPSVAARYRDVIEASRDRPVAPSPAAPRRRRCCGRGRNGPPSRRCWPGGRARAGCGWMSRSSRRSPTSAWRPRACCPACCRRGPRSGRCGWNRTGCCSTSTWPGPVERGARPGSLAGARLPGAGRARPQPAPWSAAALAAGDAGGPRRPGARGGSRAAGPLPPGRSTAARIGPGGRPGGRSGLGCRARTPGLAGASRAGRRRHADAAARRLRGDAGAPRPGADHAAVRPQCCAGTACPAAGRSPPGRGLRPPARRRRRARRHRLAGGRPAGLPRLASLGALAPEGAVRRMAVPAAGLPSDLADPATLGGTRQARLLLGALPPQPWQLRLGFAGAAPGPLAFFLDGRRHPAGLTQATTSGEAGGTLSVRLAAPTGQAQVLGLAWPGAAPAGLRLTLLELEG
ncbi:glycosyltransferase [Paeniroseomonas aquatica]|uniref:glycosyltransferase family protein n=1 Tax=Paeniroseomonas aquatica TaxID=373043 RepID=UPI003617DED5